MKLISSLILEMGLLKTQEGSFFKIEAFPFKREPKTCHNSAKN